MSINRSGITPPGATGGALAGYPDQRRVRRVTTNSTDIERTLQSTDGTLVIDMVAGPAEVFLPDLDCVPENLPISIIKINADELTVTPMTGQLVMEAASDVIPADVSSAQYVSGRSTGTRSWYRSTDN
jgi:hypothetical protein